MKIIIAGAGFGGLRLARKLNNKAGFEIILLDRFNYHQFQPLFYQVATGGLEPSSISFPLRKVFQKSKNVRIRLAELEGIIPGKNKIKTSIGEMNYDVLVLAMGANTNFFGNAAIAKNAFSMKSTPDALQLRNSLLLNFENALTATDQNELERLMNIVVVGGGPTGVELSGALAEMKKYVLPKDYPELDFSKMNIFLVEGTGKTLGNMSDKSSEQSKRYLEKLGVKLLMDQLVKNYDGKNVLLSNGDIIPSATVIWAAGIKGNIVEGIEKSMIGKAGRIAVDRECRLPVYNNIYCIGDLALMKTPKYPDGHPQVAPVAIQQAELLSKKLKSIVKQSDSLYEFEYRDKGTMATIGRNLAVVDIPIPKAFGTKLHFRGFFAWLIWMGLHLMLILGVKNRFFVFINWLYNYITYDQNLRLIVKNDEGKNNGS